MLKKSAILGIIAIMVGLLTTNCKSNEIAAPDTNNPDTSGVNQLETPNVSVEVLSGGEGVRLTWDSVPYAEGYIIRYGEREDTTAELTISITVPAAQIEVRAFKDTILSSPWVGDFKAVETRDILWYTRADTTPEHHSGLTILDNGTVLTKSYANDPHIEIDFVANLDNTIAAIESVDPNVNKKNGVAYDPNYDYNSMDIAPEDGYTFYKKAIQGGTYALLRANSTSWSTTDRFAKLIIRGISGVQWKVDITVQPIGGLRWLVK